MSFFVSQIIGISQPMLTKPLRGFSNPNAPIQSVSLAGAMGSQQALTDSFTAHRGFGEIRSTLKYVCNLLLLPSGKRLSALRA